VEKNLEIIRIAALLSSDFSAFQKFCTKTRARKPFRSFRMTIISLLLMTSTVT